MVDCFSIPPKIVGVENGATNCDKSDNHALSLTLIEPEQVKERGNNSELSRDLYQGWSGVQNIDLRGIPSKFF